MEASELNTGMECDFEEFKRRAKQLIDAAPTLGEDGLDNAIKMFNLSYLNLRPASDLEQHMAAIALRLTLKQVGAF